jgi:hypothetical protein
MLAVLLLSLLESRMFIWISTAQGVTAVWIRTHVIAARVYTQSILRWIYHSTIGQRFWWRGPLLRVKDVGVEMRRCRGQELCLVLRLRLDMIDGVIRILITIWLYLLLLVLECGLGGKPAGDLKGCAWREPIAATICSRCSNDALFGLKAETRIKTSQRKGRWGTGIRNGVLKYPRLSTYPSGRKGRDRTTEEGTRQDTVIRRGARRIVRRHLALFWKGRTSYWVLRAEGNRVVLDRVGGTIRVWVWWPAVVSGMDEWRHLGLRRAPEVELAAETDVFALEFLKFVGDSSGGRKRLELLGSKAEDCLELCHILLELFDISLALCSMACLGAGVPRTNRAIQLLVSAIGSSRECCGRGRAR